MQKILQNPYVVGPSAGILAVIIHYVNQKMVQKKEKVDNTELGKVFVVMTLLVGGSVFMAQKKGLLKGPKSVQSGGSVPPVGNIPASTPTPTPTVRTPQTISANPSPNTSGLVISDINDIIHTGNPNF